MARSTSGISKLAEIRPSGLIQCRLPSGALTMPNGPSALNIIGDRPGEASSPTRVATPVGPVYRGMKLRRRTRAVFKPPRQSLRLKLSIKSKVRRCALRRQIGPDRAVDGTIVSREAKQFANVQRLFGNNLDVNPLVQMQRVLQGLACCEVKRIDGKIDFCLGQFPPACAKERIIQLDSRSSECRPCEEAKRSVLQFEVR